MSASAENSIRPNRANHSSLNRTLLEIAAPILIMLMIGALIYFLIEIFYRGPHAGRLRWVMGLFTLASVLVSRISIEEGLERAALFGFALAAATLTTSIALVDFEYGALAILEPVVMIIFISIVMWSANRLTWDCTVIDSSRDVSSIGLSELIKRNLLRRSEPKPNTKSTSSDTTAAENPGGMLFWFFANNKTQNTPGLWVLYFSLAAFPIFGIGQWFSRSDSGWGYRWLFLLFAVYLAAGLGLLMLTSLLGLERYLNKRGARMPGAVSRAWLVAGTLFAMAIMLVVLVLPSPNISSGMENALGWLTTNSKEPSKFAVGKDGQKEGQQPQGEKPGKDQNAKAKKDADGGQAKGGGKNGKSSDKKSNQGKNGGKDKSGKKQNQSKQNAGDSKKQQSQSSDSDKNKQSNSRPNDKNKSQDSKKPNKSDADKNGSRQQDPKSRQQEKNADEKNKQNGDQANQNQPKADQNDARKQDQNRQNQANNQPNNRRNGRPQNQQPANQPQPAPSSNFLSSLGSGLRYLVYVIGFVLLLVVAWMFRDELAKLWEELFGKKKVANDPGPTTKKQPRPAKPLPSFSQFKEPFSNGHANQWPAAKTIQYTLQALEAWARGHQQHREQDLTPHEFATQLNSVNETVAKEAHQLADLWGQSFFSQSPVDRRDVSRLKSLWQAMLASPAEAKQA